MSFEAGRGKQLLPASSEKVFLQFPRKDDRKDWR